MCMRVVNSMLLVLVGVVAGIAVVVSCGDRVPAKVDAAVDGPSPADAAKCDCPAAEPPLAGRFMIVGNAATVAPNDRGFQGATCPADTQLITGSCGPEDASTFYDLTLQESALSYDLR